MVRVCAGIPSESERLQEKQHCTVISLQTLYLSFTAIQSFPFFTKHRKFFDQFPSTLFEHGAIATSCYRVADLKHTI